jgi:predicted ATPase
VTSRERLNLQAEWVFDVEGLAFPPDIGQDATSGQGPRAYPADVADLANYSAVQLFVQRARQVQPKFALSEPTLATIGRISRQVAGMPLALELAASSMRFLPPAEIERQIGLSLDVLSTTWRDMPGRHHSMRAVFDHSWHLLSELERALFSRLAVFRGGCTVESAEQVAGATLPALATLVDKSLLRQSSLPARGSTTLSTRSPAFPGSPGENDRGELGRDGFRALPNAAAETRLKLLEPLRDYALEKLQARGEEKALRRAHAAYYLALAEAVTPHWNSPTVNSALAKLDREYNNVRAALQWTFDSGTAGDVEDIRIGLELSAALLRYWRSRLYLSEGRIWLEELLALHDQNPDPVSIDTRMRALHGAAWLAADQHDFDRAKQLFEQSALLGRAVGETGDETSLLINAALQARDLGQYDRASDLLEDVLGRQREVGDLGTLSTGGFGYTLYALGLVLREQGDFERAAALFGECIKHHHKLGDREGTAQGRLGLSDVARDQADAAGVRNHTEGILLEFRELGAQWAVGFALNNLALAAYVEGDLQQAVALASEGAALFRDRRENGGLAEVLVTMGHVLRAQGELRAARETLNEALQLAWVMGPRLVVVTALEALGILLAQQADQGEASLAVRLLAATSDSRTRMGTPLRPVDRAAVEHALATIRQNLGDAEFTAQSEAGRAMPLDEIISVVSTIPDAVAPGDLEVKRLVFARWLV